MCRRYDIPEGYLSLIDISRILNVSHSFVGKTIIKDINTEQYGSAKLVKIADFISEFPNLVGAVSEYKENKEIQALTINDIANILNLSASKVNNMLKNGELDSFCANKVNGTSVRVLKSDFLKEYPEYTSAMYRVLYNFIETDEDVPVVDVKRKHNPVDDNEPVEPVEVNETPQDDFDKISDTSSEVLADLTDDEKELEEEEQESVDETENELQAIVNAANGYSTAPVQDALVLAGQFDNECEEEPVEIVQDDTILTQLHDMTDESEKHSIPFKRYCELTYINTIIGSCTKGPNINKFSIRKKDVISGMEYEIVEYIDSLKHKVTCTRYYVIGVDDEEESRMLVCSITYDSKHRISSKAEFVPSPYMNYPALQYSDFYTYHDNDVVSKRVRLCGEAITTQTFDRDGNLKDIQSELFVNDMTNTVNHGYDRVKLTNR
jgi:hypothetical protein